MSHLSKTPRRITRTPDGRWMNGDTPLVFLWLPRMDRLPLVHVADETTLDGWLCGALTAASRKLVRADQPPPHHILCRKCNYFGHFGTYGSEITPHDSRFPIPMNTPPKHCVIFRARPSGSGSNQYIRLKKSLSRTDYHGPGTPYSNSDLFAGTLLRACREILGNRDHIQLAHLPERVSVDASGFLHVITIDLTGLPRFP